MRSCLGSWLLFGQVINLHWSCFRELRQVYACVGSESNASMALLFPASFARAGFWFPCFLPSRSVSATCGVFSIKTSYPGMTASPAPTWPISATRDHALARTRQFVKLFGCGSISKLELCSHGWCPRYQRSGFSGSERLRVSCSQGRIAWTALRKPTSTFCDVKTVERRGCLL